MVKPKTQIKAPMIKEEKSKLPTVGRPSRKNKVTPGNEGSEAGSKPRRGSTDAVPDTPEKTPGEMAEEDTSRGEEPTPATPVRMTEIAKAVMAAKEPNLITAKIAKAKVLREGKAPQVKDPDKAPLAPQDLEARRLRLKNLIVQGKERGYLTYAEINDHLPDDMLDAEQIENIISMINDVGISVYDEAPDAETLLMSETAPTVADEDVVEEAEAALSTVDSEFGRTTDPVRMYMREMGSVELLTRESEIEIAKRIEDGLKHMIQAISACPTTIAAILDLAAKVAKDEMRVDELVDGLLDPDSEQLITEEIPDESLEQELSAEGSEDEDIVAIANANLLKLKNDALERFTVIQQAYAEMQKALEKKGSSNRTYKEIHESIYSELMAIRFSAKMVERLCDTQRALVDEMSAMKRGRRVRLLFASMADKDWELMLDSLAKSVDEIVLTRVAMERSADPSEMARKIAASTPHRVMDDPRKALGDLIDHAQENDVIVVAGSLYLLGEVRPFVEETAKARSASSAPSPMQP